MTSTAIVELATMTQSASGARIGYGVRGDVLVWIVDGAEVYEVDHDDVRLLRDTSWGCDWVAGYLFDWLGHPQEDAMRAESVRLVRRLREAIGVAGASAVHGPSADQGMRLRGATA